MRLLRPLSFLSAALLVAACNAEEPVNETASATQPAAVAAADFDRQALIDKFTQLRLQVVDVVASDIDGMVEIQTSSGVLFSSLDGEFFIAGTLYGYDAQGNVEDVIAKRQQPLNAELIEQYTDSMIEFKADNEKHVMTVFTDITCGYCVKLHEEMSDYNDLGITVRYLAYPRQGPTGQVAEQMAQIWCADDQQAAMRDGKLTRKFPAKTDNFEQCLATVQDNFALGRQLGINGTPAMFTTKGEQIGGYVPAAALLQQLEQ
ncbi:thioredoxin fold domain-containing protein [Vibrio sp. WXL103]|uniref:thioredoxin fold domain-containing protein n=1 Tax=Vibrio sp. WXL103 TaxID=3450710 RepID=UPI003EC66BCA